MIFVHADTMYYIKYCKRTTQWLNVKILGRLRRAHACVPCSLSKTSEKPKVLCILKWSREKRAKFLVQHQNNALQIHAHTPRQQTNGQIWAIAKIAHSRFALTDSIHIILIKNKKNRHTHTHKHCKHEYGMTDGFNNARNSS